MPHCTLVIEYVPHDMQIRPTVGKEHELTRDQARAMVHTLLDLNPAAADLAETWRNDAAKDDTVFTTDTIWPSYQCQDDCESAYQAVTEERVGIFRRSGHNVDFARPPARVGTSPPKR